MGCSCFGILSVLSKFHVKRGYSVFGGEYQIYFIEFDENISKFASTQHE